MAKADGRATDELLALCALEGFLDRLSSSPRADASFSKGGVLLAAYDRRRPTRDIDLQARHLAGDADTVLALVRDIAAVQMTTVWSSTRAAPLPTPGRGGVLRCARCAPRSPSRAHLVAR
jgi:hypothetical protein